MNRSRNGEKMLPLMILFDLHPFDFLPRDSLENSSIYLYILQDSDKCTFSLL